MKTIHKYTIPLLGPRRVAVEMPKGAFIIAVQAQRDEPCIWAVVDTAEPFERRIFGVFGTGHELPNDGDWCHRGTVQVRGGEFVFHVFERFP